MSDLISSLLLIVGTLALFCGLSKILLSPTQQKWLDDQVFRGWNYVEDQIRGNATLLALRKLWVQRLISLIASAPLVYISWRSLIMEHDVWLCVLYVALSAAMMYFGPKLIDKLLSGGLPEEIYIRIFVVIISIPVIVLAIIQAHLILALVFRVSPDVFVNWYLDATLMSICSTITLISAPVLTLTLTVALLCISEFILRRLNEQSTGPVVAIGALCALFGAYFKLIK